MYGISIEHKNKTITITKKFEKLTKNFASDESKELGRAMRQYPTYKLKIREIEKNPDKMTYKGLTYDIMKDYFTANKADRAKYLRDKLDEMRGRKNGKRDVTMIVCSYAEIKAWFFAECPEIEKHNEEIIKLCKDSKKDNLKKTSEAKSSDQFDNNETTTPAESDVKTFTPTEVIKNPSLSVEEVKQSA